MQSSLLAPAVPFICSEGIPSVKASVLGTGPPWPLKVFLGDLLDTYALAQEEREIDEFSPVDDPGNASHEKRMVIIGTSVS